MSEVVFSDPLSELERLNEKLERVIILLERISGQLDNPRTHGVYHVEEPWR